MKSKKYFYFQDKANGFKFVVDVVKCSKPERTKAYKKLLHWYLTNHAYAIGYCDAGYYQDKLHEFINTLPIKPNQ